MKSGAPEGAHHNETRKDRDVLMDHRLFVGNFSFCTDSGELCHPLAKCGEATDVPVEGLGTGVGAPAAVGDVNGPAADARAQRIRR